MDGRPFRHAPRLRGRDRPFHLGFLSLWNFERHSPAGCLPASARLRRGDDGPRRPLDAGADVRQIRVDPCHEFCRHPRANRADVRALARRPNPSLSRLEIRFLRKHSHRRSRAVDGLSPFARLSRGKDPTARSRRPHPLRIRRRAAFLCARDFRRTYAWHARNHRVARCGLFADSRLRLARAAGAISPPAIAFVPDSSLPRGRQRQFHHAHRHRRRAVPPAAPLSGRTWCFTHSVGSPDHAAGLRRHVQQVVRGGGAATLGLSGAPGLQHGHPRTTSFLFATIGVGTPVWLIVLQAFAYGIFTSMQYTSMNTLAYADLAEPQTSNGSSLASTVQQLSISFGVATAGLTTAVFVPNR